MKRSLALLALILPIMLGANATVASAQASVVNQLLSSTDNRILALGFSRSDAVSDGTIRGSLRNSASETTVARLRAGVQYVIIGMCDEDCSDLDIILYPASGSNALVRDLLDDDAPIVRYEPTTTGDYRIYVSMADCDVQPCGYAVRIYEKTPGAAVSQAGNEGSSRTVKGERVACSHTTATDVLLVGDDRRGIIGANSCMQADGTPANMYRLDVTERRNVRITMSSSDFDAYLSLYRADGTLIVNDDDGGDEGTDSEISMTLTPGTYYVAANVISASSAGSYRLTVR